MKKEWIKAITSFSIISILVIGISTYFVFESFLIGPLFLLLGLFTSGIVKYLGIDIRSTYPDMIFGAIDNGFLVLAAVLGGQFGGVAGAIVAGAAGNTITDGVGGFFEGKIAAKLKKMKITRDQSSISSMLGKMAGCLYGAGVGLIFVSIIF